MRRDADPVFPSRSAPAAPRDSDTRRRLIDGATACLLRYGFGKTTIDDVSAETGVSRRTVYRYFRTREELFIAVLRTELDELSRTNRRTYDTVRPFSEAVVEATIDTVRTVGDSPSLRRLFVDHESEDYVEKIFGSASFVTLTERHLRPVVERARRRGELRRDVSVKLLAEWLNHVTFWLLLRNPVIDRRNEKHVRRLLETFVTPALVATGRGSSATSTSSPGRADAVCVDQHRAD